MVDFNGVLTEILFIAALVAAFGFLIKMIGAVARGESERHAGDIIETAGILLVLVVLLVKFVRVLLRLQQGF